MSAAVEEPAKDREDTNAAILSAKELKEKGNNAYQHSDIEAAVALWNQAIRKHVSDLAPGSSTVRSSIHEDRELERSIYLNLAQGYLKLDEPEKALRACKVVIHDHKDDIKARYRAAEACLALNKMSEAEQWLIPILELQPTHSQATRLLRQVKATRREEHEKQKAIAKKMYSAAAGFSEGRSGSEVHDAFTGTLSHMNPASIADGIDIADEVAAAARQRTARLAQGKPLPEPKVMDFDSFRAKALEHSRKYAAHAERSRKRCEDKQRSVHLTWLRRHPEGSDFNDFMAPLREEVRLISEEQAQIQDAQSEEGDCGDSGSDQEVHVAEQAVVTASSKTSMDEMD